MTDKSPFIAAAARVARAETHEDLTAALAAYDGLLLVHDSDGIDPAMAPDEGATTTHRGVVLTRGAGLWLWQIGDHADGADLLIDAQLQIDEWLEGGA